MAQLITPAPLRRAHVRFTYRTPTGQIGTAVREVVTQDLTEALRRVKRQLEKGATGRGRSRFLGEARWIEA
jgi:uncharacterized membrane protein